MIVKVSYRYQFKGDATWHVMVAENVFVPDGGTAHAEQIAAAVLDEHDGYAAVQDARVIDTGQAD